MQFSIRTLLISVTAAAVAITSLLYANDLWSRLWITVCFLALLSACVGVIYARFERRAFLIGFAILGWGYFLLTWGVIGELTADDLLGGVLVVWLNEYVLSTFWRNDPSAAAFSFGVPSGDRIAHSLINLAIAFCGGALGRFAYRQREPIATQPPPLP